MGSSTIDVEELNDHIYINLIISSSAVQIPVVMQVFNLQGFIIKPDKIHGFFIYEIVENSVFRMPKLCAYSFCRTLCP
ncbi:MAG: hypothetical protein SVZ03_06845 [Spirochaetota bacterium]|nr:hypothetical protein [Spirochaetota bacterium]